MYGANSSIGSYYAQYSNASLFYLWRLEIGKKGATVQYIAYSVVLIKYMLVFKAERQLNSLL